MDEYINRTKLIEDIESRFCKDCDPGSGTMLCRKCEVSCAIRELKGAPKAEVAEVKHGHWIDLNITEWQCSECKYRVERWNNTPHCPDCGTKMDGGK